jgi:putative colanic acid biosynthesis acetyltransferase WcaF
MKQTILSQFNNSWYKPGSTIMRTTWYAINTLFFNTSLLWPTSIKILLLKLFGAKTKHALNLKPHINIKYPWFLSIGNNTWLGESCWIDNLAQVTIGSNVCISQGAMLLTGNHDYTKSTFDLTIGPITIEDGVWVGAKSVICPNVTLGSHSVICAGSVVTKNTEPYTIYQGNPALPVRKRIISK